MGRNLTKSGGRIITETGVVIAEVAERKTVQMPAVGRVAEGTEIGVVRGNDNHSASVCQQAVELFHGADDVADVFDDVHGADFAKAGVGEGKRKLVEIGDDVGAGFRIPVESDGAGIFVDAAANVQYRQLPRCCR